MRIRAIVPFGLIFSLASLAWCRDLSKLDQELRTASPAQAKQALERHFDDLIDDEDLSPFLERDLSANDLAVLRRQLRLRVEMDQLSQKAKGASKLAQKLEREGSFGQPEKAKRDNWLSRAGQRVGQLLEDLLKGQCKRQQVSEASSGPGLKLDWLSQAAYLLLIVLVAVGLFFAVRTFGWKWQRRGRVGAILEEDEPDRTADEWLQNAAGLEVQGKYREAVRSLYLACLVKMDDHGVARFVRSETNWEHYHRIHHSARRPADLDFLEPTRRFDTIWYGHQVRGAEDVQFFREVYQRVCMMLERQAA